MRTSASVQPESLNKMEPKEEKTAPTPLKLPPLQGKTEGGPNDFSLPLPQSGGIELSETNKSGSSLIDIPGIDMGKDGESSKKPVNYDPYPLYQLKGRNLIAPEQMKCTRDSLNSGDVFVLDMRAHPLYCVVQWTGAEGNRREKAAGRLFCDKLHLESTKLPTKPIVVELMDRQTPIEQHLAHADAFWEILGGRGPVKSADEAEDDRTVTLTRRKSLKIERRNSLLANMNAGETFRYLMKERMEGVSQVVHSTWWTVWISSLTVYALFGDDLRFCLTDKSADPWFFSISIVALIFFVAEIFLNWISNPKWCCGFYFWLDFAATVSLIPDIGWIWDPLFAGISGDGGGGGDGDSAQEALKTGRSSRSGAKAGRVVRVVRLVRMVRMVKLYKMHGNQEASDKVTRAMSTKESKVGSILSEKTTRKVIVLVLVLILFLPQFDGFNETTNQYHRGGLMGLHSWARDLNCNGATGTAEAAGADYVVNRDHLFKPLVQDYVRRVGRLIYLDIANLNVSLQDPDHPSDYNSTTWFAEGTKFTSTAQEDSLNLLPAAPVGDEVSIKYDATSAATTDWGDTNYQLKLQNLSFIDAYYRESEHFREQVYGCNTKFIENGCQDPTLINQWEGETFSQCYSMAIINVKPEQQMDAGLNIVKTLFVMMVLVWGAVTFQSDAQRLVVGPIERMMDTVTLLAKNPLANTNSNMTEMEGETKSEKYETQLLEKTIEKVSTLMQVGFGAAGAEVIGANMQGEDGSVNTMMDGTVITSIYGFCDIRKFTDTTECLQEQVMTYVNSLGDIVHSATHRWFGMANKNVGDAFLLSWKICDGLLPGFHDFLETQHGKEFYQFDECQRLRAEHAYNLSKENLDDLLKEQSDLQQKLIATEGLMQGTKKSKQKQEEIDYLKEELHDIQCEIDAPPLHGQLKPARPGKGGGKVDRYVTPVEMADAAFAAFITACVDLNNANIDGCCVPFINHPRCVARFGKGFTIRMGFGMHVGWCVQGAIGSRFKIDCTYLSPHVELSDRLEAGSKIFVTPMNLSHWFVALMSPTIKQHLRAIDRIKIAGVPVPMTVYTFDIFNYEACRRQPFLPRHSRNGQRSVDFITDSSCRELQRGMDPNFLSTFRQGYKHYIDGEWGDAKECLIKVMEMRSANQYNDNKTGLPLPDGPSTQLLKYMGSHNFTAPTDWDGVHVMEGY